MDTAVALVRAYLHLNGYFTVTEYPVLEHLRGGDYRAVTDIDVLAFRFPGAALSVLERRGRKRRRRRKGRPYQRPDPVLELVTGQVDMLIAEVKEGRARLNRAARDPAVLRAVLVRFGCCHQDEAETTVKQLLSRGEASTADGHRLRMVVFGSTGLDGEAHVETIAMGHVVGFLRDYLDAHWDLVRHAEVKDPALGFLLMVEKALRGLPNEHDAYAENRGD